MYIRLTDLKSNMDRFIEQKVPDLQVGFKHLKSNMDRFIECKAVVQHSANVI